MTNLNKKILEWIEKSDYDSNLKSFLKSLLMFEFRHMNDARPVYSADYDRAITTYLSNVKEPTEEE